MTSEKLREAIVKSLTLTPGSMDALKSRPLFNGISEASLDKLLEQLARENKIYKKGIRYYAYKETRLPGHSKKAVNAILKSKFKSR